LSWVDAVNHVLTPTGVAVLLLFAGVVDYWSVGPDSLRDRLAFLMYTSAIREGFNGSPLDRWTVGALTGAIGKLLHSAGTAYIAGASANVVLAAGVGCLAVYVLGAVLPNKMSTTFKFGRFAALTFPTSPVHRINYRLLICAVMLGMMADLPAGAVGAFLPGAIDWMTGLFAPGLNWLFGVH
jgi:hypothetical protein